MRLADAPGRSPAQVVQAFATGDAELGCSRQRANGPWPDWGMRGPRPGQRSENISSTPACVTGVDCIGVNARDDELRQQRFSQFGDSPIAAKTGPAMKQGLSELSTVHVDPDAERDL
jgi:hypothetical protein